MILKDLDIGISKIEEIRTDADSYPFTSAERYVGLSSCGYVEREYYIYGKADVYQTDKDRTISVKYTGADYCNRIVVRAPDRPERFSGNVVVEIINPTSSMDIERMWILGYREFLRRGDIYVGITSKPNTIAKLREFDEARYGRLSWKNPTPHIPFPFTSEDIKANKDLLPDQDIGYETGMFWDMLSDLAILLRSSADENPISAYNPRSIALTGWSQSANYLIKYVNDFAYRRELDVDLFDGYLAVGPPRHFNIPVNQYETLSCLDNDVVKIRKVKNPCIILQTESENALQKASEIVRNDGLEEEFQCRHYDIAGASHDTVYTMLDYYKKDPDLERIHMLPCYNGLNREPNNYPLHIMTAAAFRNLFYWINTGVAPAACERIVVSNSGDNCKDALGNTIGGLRTCLLDYPTGSYFLYSDIEKGKSFLFPDSDKDILFGHEEPFPREMLVRMYGSLNKYERLVKKHTMEQVAKGFVVKEDAGELVRIAVEIAKKRGLE